MSIDQAIDEYVRASKALTGKVIVEREQWNNVATADAIRHYCNGIGDDNPRWLDSGIAPPTFLTSVLYPALHGAPMEVPLSNLIGELEYAWEQPIPVGSPIQATTRQVDLQESTDRHGRRLVLVTSQVAYRGPNDEPFGTATCVMVQAAKHGPALLFDRQPVPYSTEEAIRLQEQILGASRRGASLFSPAEVGVGASLPQLVVGPLTLGDLICWQAAIGPSYRAGPLGLRDALDSPHTTVTNPVIGWPVKYSQQHEDFNLTTQRGMPTAFDNSVMRLSQMSRQLTNWMGDSGTLVRLKIQTGNPILYGDVTWFDATISKQTRQGDGYALEVTIVGVNQLGETNTHGQAQILVPASQVAVPTLRLRERRSDPPQTADTPSVATSIIANAQAHPDRVAIQADDCSLTYREMVERASGIAELLKDRGIGPGSVVGVSVPRTSMMPVAVLAVMFTGAAYCPLDSDLPQQRLELLIASANPDAILATAETSAHPALTNHSRLLVDPSTARSTTSKLEGRAVGEDHAYIIHTSGSGGTPKAVAVSHQALARYMTALRRTLDVSEDDRYLFTASLSFSAASRQLWYPLTAGAQLVVAGRADVGDPAALFSTMRRCGVTIWDTVPTFWARTVTAVEATNSDDRATVYANKLRLILTTGEALPWTTPNRWRAATGGSQRLVNLYSQTETAGTACTHELPPESTDATGTVPLGVPMFDVDIHVLDQDLQPVVHGQVGEICVESHRLSDGYLDEVGNDRFLNDSSGGKPRSIYRTGDLGRLGSDGVLRITGRADARMKIRGFRIDPTEVEAALERHPAVQRAAVAARSGPLGDDTLVAYLELSASNPPTATDLRTDLLNLLPDYAVPSVFEALDQLPVNNSGKLNRGRLEHATGKRLGGASTRRPASTPEEGAISASFASVLGYTEFGVDEDFLDLGGHSLLAIDLASRIHTDTGMQLNIADIFEHSTVAGLAQHLAGLNPTESEPGPVAVPRDEPLLLSPGQEALWVLDQFYPADPFYNMVWPIALRGPLDIGALERSLLAMVVRHESLRTTFDFKGGDPVQVVGSAARWELGHVDLAHLDPQERQSETLRLTTEQGRAAFDLAAGPLVRVTLVRETPDQHLLLLVAHHIIADMLSMAVLLEDLLRHYDAERHGKPDPLTPLPMQYADVAAWQRLAIGTAQFAARADERVAQLRGAPRLLVPAELARPNAPSHRGLQSTAALSEKATAAIRTLARNHRATVFMTCLGAYKLLLRDRSGQQDLLVGSPIAGRDRREFAGLVGMFVNTLPIRTTLGLGTSIASVIDAVRESSLTAFRYADVPLSHLVGELNPDRDGTGQPLIDVLFQYQEDPLEGVGLDDLAVSRVPLHTSIVAFDLQLSITDRGNELQVTLDTAADLFTQDWTDQLLADYISILES